MLNRISNRFDAAIWQRDLDTIRRPRRWGIIAVRLGQVLFRDIQSGEITMRAMGLVYTTLLSLVPLLALAFSMLKAFGVNNALRPVLHRFLAPLGAQADEIIDKVVGFVENVQVGLLGAIGVVLLMYSVISLIQKVENGCNYIWQVRKPRSLGRRFTEYLSVLIVGPIVILAATSMTASLSNNTVVGYLSTIEPFGASLYLIGRLVPYVLYSIGFTFLFAFMPNTKVNILPAIGGGVFAGVLWQTASLGFAVFASNAGNVNAVYSSFAILILLLIWLYVSWLIMLTGCRVAFLLQHGEQLTRAPYPPRLGAYQREEIALLMMSLIGYNFMQGNTPWQVARLARYIGAAPDHVYDIVDQLVEANILIESGDTTVTLLPRQDIECLKVNDILDAVRRGDPTSAPNTRDDAPHREVMAWIARKEKARHDTFGDLSLRGLVSASMREKERAGAGPFQATG
ncbi:YihY/virulence factor BrkB family protein [Salinisphaera aquimarina]|uniref:YihY/virulence factor BrkB family protein n=1 Tax=Salinisphaera aquimarina TaxID=2094031 RepID=A0ABV7ELG9_9GAMM